jgi:DNA-binding transcriptional LysR family regulator
VDLHTRRLRYFATLAEELHFTRAANRLHVSQQGLSRSIRELEQDVGVRLLTRTTRTVTLTEAGSAFLVDAREALAAIDRAIDAAHRAHTAIAGELRVGFTVSSALELTTPILRAFQERYPAVDVQLEQFHWSDPSCGLVSNATEVAFVRLPIDCPDLSTEPLLTEPRAVGVGLAHRLAAARTVELRDLVGESIMAPRTDDATWSGFWTLRDTGLDPDQLPGISRAAATMEEELEAVAAGFAVSVTAISMSRFTPRPSVVFRPIVDVRGSELALGWRGQASPLAEAFRSVAAELRDREPALIRRIESANGRPEEF